MSNGITIKISHLCEIFVYRSRPKGSLDKDILEFLSSMNDDLQLLQYDVIGSEAHVVMLKQIGILAVHEAKVLLEALEEVRHNPEILTNTDVEDIHESIESHIVQKLGIEIGGKIQIARSRNDQVILDIRMKIRDEINETSEQIIILITSLLERAKNYFETIMPMYTHLRQAQIGTFSHFLLSYAEALLRDMGRLHDTYARVNQSPLGAGAVGGSSIKIDRQRTARLLGFDGLVRNSIDATTSRDTILEFTAGLAILMVTLSRMTEDFIIWSTDEFEYLDISDSHGSSSSAMPHKKNPDPLELIRAKAAAVLGNFVAMITVVKGLPSGYSRDLQEIKNSLWQACDATHQALRIMNYIVNSLIINERKMLQASSNSYAISLDLAEILVTKNNVPFRLAHKIVGSLVQKAITDKKRPLNMLGEEEIRQVVKSFGWSLPIQDILRTIRQTTPQISINSRQSFGSPNPKQQPRMVKLLKRKMVYYVEEVTKRKRRNAQAMKDLSETVTALTVRHKENN
jgi:argininosuccinate lyase